MFRRAVNVGRTALRFAPRALTGVVVGTAAIAFTGYTASCSSVKSAQPAAQLNYQSIYNEIAG